MPYTFFSTRRASFTLPRFHDTIHYHNQPGGNHGYCCFIIGVGNVIEQQEFMTGGYFAFIRIYIICDILSWSIYLIRWPKWDRLITHAERTGVWSDIWTFMSVGPLRTFIPGRGQLLKPFKKRIPFYLFIQVLFCLLGLVLWEASLFIVLVFNNTLFSFVFAILFIQCIAHTVLLFHLRMVLRKWGGKYLLAEDPIVSVYE